MDMDITAAVLHLKEAARLFQDVHSELSLTLLRVANAFIQTESDAEDVRRMEIASDEITGTQNGSSD